MNKTLKILLISLLSSVITLVGYKYIVENNTSKNINAEVTADNIITKSTNIGNTNNSLEFTEAAEKTVHTVVHVKNLSYVTTPNNPMLEFFYGSRSGQTHAQIGTGSGVIISEDGYIVTNNHVIEGASELEVTVNNNQSYKAKLIGTDQKMDIALLKIETDQKLPYITFGDSDEIRLGEWVLAVGNPYNLNSTVTAGIISAKARNLSKDGIQSFIQTDAVVNSGNSGGALVNTNGELIGINTLISSNTGSYVGYSFAVPSNVTRKIIEDLIEFGNVQQGILGIQGFELNNNIAKEKNLTTTQGFYVDKVNKNSGAEKGGIKSGDIITKINNKDINTFVDLNSVLNTKRPNDNVSVTIMRKKEEITLDIKLVKREALTIEFQGFEFQDLSADEKKKLKLQIGIKITKITNPNYLEYRDELENSVLLSIDRVKIDNADTASKIFSKPKPNQKFRLEIINSKGEIIRLLL